VVLKAMTRSTCGGRTSGMSSLLWTVFKLANDATVSYLFGYSRGQAKPANPVSRQGMHLRSEFFQIVVLICEIRRKIHHRSFSHGKLAMPNFLDRKIAKSGSKIGRNGPRMVKNMCPCRSSAGKQSEKYQKRVLTEHMASIAYESAIGDAMLMTFSWSRHSRHIKTNVNAQFRSMFRIFFREKRSISCFDT